MLVTSNKELSIVWFVLLGRADMKKLPTQELIERKKIHPDK